MANPPILATATTLDLPTSTTTYVALGDSFSSGEGNPPFLQISGSCDVSAAGSWPEKVANDLQLDLRGILACSGAQTSALTSSFNGQLPQLQLLKRSGGSPTLVTITIGGNDLGFAQVLESCFLALCGPRIVGVLGQLAGGFGTHMTQIYREIRAAAPHARVLVVGYPQIMSADPLNALLYCPWLKDPTEPIQLRSLAGSVNSVLARSASAARVNYVSTLNAFQGHELCTANPWINPIGPLGGKGRGHPNAQGQAALAGVVEAYIAGHHLISHR